MKLPRSMQIVIVPLCFIFLKVESFSKGDLSKSYLIKSIISHHIPKPSNCSLVIWTSTSITLYNNLQDLLFFLFESFIVFRNESLASFQIPKFYTKFHESCSLVLYLNLPTLFNHPELFPTHWNYNIPGGLHRSYHVIFHKQMTSNKSESKGILPLSLPFKLMINQLLVLSTELSSDLKLVSTDILGRKFLELNPKTLFPDRSHFKGEELIWAFIPSSPYFNQFYLDAYIHSKRRPPNFEYEPIVEISQMLNATPRLNLVTSRKFGRQDLNTGKWDGLVGEVTNGRAHVTQWIILTKDRNDALILSVPVGGDGVGFITGLPSSSMNFLTFLSSTFEWRIWLSQLLIVGAMSIFLKIDADKSLRNTGRISKMYVFIFMPTLDQSQSSKEYYSLTKNISSRMVIGPWLICIIVLGSVFKTNLITSLTSPIIQYPPLDFASLVKSDYKVHFMSMNFTVAGTVFRALKQQGNMIVTELDKRLVKDYNSSDSDACLRQSQLGDNVCLGMQQTVKFLAGISLTQESGDPLYLASKDSLVGFYSVYGISKELPHIEGQINKKAYQTLESGTQQYEILNLRSMLRKHAKASARERRTKGTLYPSEKDSGDNFKRMLATYNALLILCVGCGLGIIAMLTEIFSRQNSKEIVR